MNPIMLEEYQNNDIKDYQKKIHSEVEFNNACAALSRANNLSIYSDKHTKFNKYENIPINCEWCCDNICKNFKDTPIYYFNTISEELVLCYDCGNRIKTNNEDEDIIFCYKIEYNQS